MGRYAEDIMDNHSFNPDMDLAEDDGLDLTDSEEEEGALDENGDATLARAEFSPDAAHDLFQEASKWPYETIWDYCEMANQMSWILMFSGVLPFIPILCFVNNIFEIRTDHFKMCFQFARIIPHRRRGIGEWKKVRGHACVFGVVHTQMRRAFLLLTRKYPHTRSHGR